MSGVLFQGWDVGKLGNTLSGCVTQDPRVPRCLKRLLLSTPLILMCVCVDVDTRVHIYVPRNLEIALRILRILRLRSNLEIAQLLCGIFRLRKLHMHTMVDTEDD